MSISRKNWSALSSMTRQWTMEDEEEVERERRRRVKSSTSAADTEADVVQSAVDKSSSGGSSDRDKSSDVSQGLSSEEQMQVDFVEMLRVRDEKRRMRHVEVLRRQKNEEEEGGEPETSRGGRGGGGGGGGATVKLPGVVAKEEDNVFTRQPPRKTSSFRTTLRTSSSSKQQENGATAAKDPDTKPPPSRQTHKFVSSVSFSLDKSPTVSVSSPPMSPCSPPPPPSTPQSPQNFRPSPCQSPSGPAARGPVQNGELETSVNGSPPSSGLNEKPAFIKQSSRTVSFRMMKKKEEDSSPMRRSSSVRLASKKFESTTEQNEDKDKTSPFQRNSKQRTSSRSIQEKMERLAQAAQKSEVTRSPDVSQRTLFLLEEVSRKRGLFEKEPQTESSTGQDFKGFSSGVSGRIDRWLNKAKQTGSSSHSPADLRHVSISSKRSLFENRGESSSGKL